MGGSRFTRAKFFLFLLLFLAGISGARNNDLQAQQPVPAQRWDGRIELISGLYPYTPPTTEPPIAANGPSSMSRHAISGDGRYIVFTATAENLGFSTEALYLRDRQTSETRVLLGGAARDAVISADGNHIAYQICDPWMRPDQQEICDIYALDLRTSSWALISESPEGDHGDANSNEPVMSADGRFVVFETSAANILGQASPVPQLVLRDRDPDGNGIFDELGTPINEIVSQGLNGVLGNGASATAEVSDDGRYVAFRSTATNLTGHGTQTTWNVYRRDRQAQQTQQINLRPDGSPSPFPIVSPVIAMSGNGEVIAFTSSDPYLTWGYPDDSQAWPDVFVFDALGDPLLERIDIGDGWPVAQGYVPGNGPSESPSISADGRYVAFKSEAVNVTPPQPAPGTSHVYVFDRVTGTPTRISIKPDGSEPDASSTQPQISRDGSLIAFLSPALNLSPNVQTAIDRIYAAVHFEVTPPEVLVPGGGGQGVFTITTQQHTQWWVDWTNLADWIHFEAAPQGVGSGTLPVGTSSANPDPTRRSATITIDQKTVTLTQLEGLSMTSVTPSSGPLTGGTAVTIRGTGLEPGLVVFFGGQPATSVDVIDTTTVVAVTPPHDTGTVFVAVFAADGQRYALIDEAFTFLDPTPTPTVTLAAFATTTYGGSAYVARAQLRVAPTQASLPGKAVRLVSNVSSGGGSVGTETLTTDAEGWVTWQAPMSPTAPVGTYSDGFQVFFDGDLEYGASTASGEVTVLQATPTVNVFSAKHVYDGQPHPIDASVTGVNGAVLGPVAITYNGSPDAPVNAGSYDVVAAFAGDANYAAASATCTVTIVKATPHVIIAGGSYTYDGTAHPANAAATGVLLEELTPLAVSYNGSPSVPVNAGTYESVATFAGDGNYVTASATATITIEKAPVSVNWPSPGVIVYGTTLGAAQLNASANVAGAFIYSPAGGTLLNAGTSQALSVVFTPSDTANYTGASASTTIDVARAPLAVRATDAVKPFGAPVPAFVASATGFVNGDSFASLGGAIAFATTASQLSPVGLYPIVPSGVTSPNYSITFVNGTLSVVRGSTAVSISTSPSPSGSDEPMTFNATVAVVAPAAGQPTGTVRFFDGTTLLGSAVLSAGHASLTTAGLDAGIRTIEARYDGDESFDASTQSAPHLIQDAAGTPVMSITSSKNPSNVGQTVTLTANVSLGGGPVGGTIEFYDGATLIGSSAIEAGRATLTTTTLPAGSHPITARYPGAADVPPSRSPIFVQAVGLPGWKDRATTMTLSSSNPSAIDAPVVFTADVTGSWNSTPTGRILFTVDGEVVGDPSGVAVTAVFGTTARATFTVTGLKHGHHKVTATYLGDPMYKGSTALVTQTVN